MRRVLIGTPSLDGRVDARYAYSLAETVLLGYKRDLLITAAGGLRVGDSTIPRARNDILRTTLEGEFDDLIFIDADQEWRPEWAIELLGYDVDFVGAPVRKKSDEMLDFNVKVSEPVIKLPLIEVDSVGCGMLRLTKYAVKTLWDRSRLYTSEGRNGRWVFEQTFTDDGELVSEDTTLCNKWRKAGGKVYVAGHMDLGHVGFKVYRGNFMEALEKVMELRKNVRELRGESE